MQWLNVPHIQQTRPGWCLPACVSMVSAYLEQPLLQDDIARWISTRGIGTPNSNVQRLTPRGFTVFYGEGSLKSVRLWLARGLPSILFVRTGDLPYWQIDTPHAVVLAGLDDTNAALFDPNFEIYPFIVPIGDLMLAWSPFDYTYTVLQVAR